MQEIAEIYIHMQRRSYYRLLFISWIFCISLFNSGQLYAQVNQDTLTVYYNKLKSGDIEGAGYIMGAYECNHPAHPQALHLLANTFFWLRDFQRAEDHYLMALKVSPGNHELQCDYAEFLLDQLRIKASFEMIQKVLVDEPNNEKALLILGKLLYWKGDLHQSSLVLSSINSTGHIAAEAKQMKEDVKIARAPRVALLPQLYADNQIMYGSINRMVIDMAYSSWFHPELNVTAEKYLVNTTFTDKYTLQIGNTFSSFISSTSLKLSGGIFYNQSNSTNVDLVYTAVFKKNLLNRFTLEAYGERKPYNFNVNSIALPFLQTEIGVSMAYINDSKIQAKMGYLVNQFDDGNRIKNMYAWGIYQFVSNDFFKLGAGIALNLNHSNSSMFVPKMSVTDWLAAGTGTVQGYYNPYFTPLQQQIFSVLGSIEKKFNHQLRLQGSISYGFIASANIPYYYPNLIYPSQLVFSSGESEMRFHPFDIKLKLNYKTKSAIEWSLGYSYIQNNFYTCQLLDAGLLFSLYHGQK